MGVYGEVARFFQWKFGRGPPIMSLPPPPSHWRGATEGLVVTPKTTPEAPVFSANWLRHFLLGMVLTAGTIALLMWGYSLWGYLAVVQSSRDGLARGDDRGVKEAVAALETPHIFSGYEPYHGFGTEKGAERAQRIATIVGRATEYTLDEQALLIRQVAHYVPAFLEHKVAGTVPLVSGDREIVATLLQRWENALASGIAFAIHASLVSLLLGLLFLAYVKFNLFARFAPPPPTGQ